MDVSTDSRHDLLVAPRIVAADKLKDGLVIRFDNGQCALYLDSFLHSKIAECKLLNEEEVAW